MWDPYYASLTIGAKIYSPVDYSNYIETKKILFS